MDYQDDVFTGSRKYSMTDNGDDTYSFTDETTYSTEGDTFGAGDLNAITQAIMSEYDTMTLLAASWSSSQYTITDSRIHISGALGSSGYYETEQEISISRSATDAQYEAFMALGLRLVSQAEGSMVIKAMDTVPTVNIPIEIRFKGWK